MADCTTARKLGLDPTSMSTIIELEAQNDEDEDYAFHQLRSFEDYGVQLPDREIGERDPHVILEPVASIVPEGMREHLENSAYCSYVKELAGGEVVLGNADAGVSKFITAVNALALAFDTGQ